MNPHDMRLLKQQLKAKRLYVKASPTIDQNVNKAIHAAQSGLTATTFRKCEPNIWRQIMRSPISKLTAMVIVVITIFIMYLMPNSPMLAIANAMDKASAFYAQCDTLHMKSRMYLEDKDIDGNDVILTNEVWLDIKNYRWQVSTPGYATNFDKKKQRNVVTIYDSPLYYDGGDYSMMLNPKEAKVAYIYVNEYAKRHTVRTLLDRYILMAFGEPDMYDRYEIEGTEIIRGELCDQYVGILNIHGETMRVVTWLSQTSGEIMKNNTYVQETDKPDRLYSTIEVMERNIECDDALFEYNIPEGYTPYNSPDTLVAGPQLGVRLSNGEYWLNHYVLFVLPDSSVIACWQSGLVEKDKDLTLMLEALEFGGDLPHLGMTPNRLTYQDDQHQKVTLMGRHLVTTQLNGQYFQWSLYVPTTEIDTNTVTGRMISYKYDYDTYPKKRLGSNSYPKANAYVLDKEDYYNFILKTMAIYSDDHAVPENLDYNSVLDLAASIREVVAE